MSKFQGLYDIRDMLPEDKNFILSTFKRGLYYGDSWFSLIPKSIFMENYGVVADALLSGKTLVKVACLKEDPDTIIGYSILTHDFQTVVWVYVKEKWRHNGIGKSLVPKHPLYVANLTELGKKLMHKLPGAVFNPFAV